MKSCKMPDYVRKQLFVCFLLYIGLIPAGINATWSSPMIVKLQDEDETPLQYIISDVQASWVTSFAYVGSIIGPHVSGKVSNMFGRKYGLLLGALMSTFGFCLKTAALNIEMLYAARAIIAFGTSIIMVTNFVIISEISSKNVRGIFLTLTAVFQSFGSVIPNVIGPFISYAAFHYFTLAVHAVYLFGIIFLPETPVFFILKGQMDKVRQAFERLGRTKEVEEELEAITESMKQNQENTWDFGEIFTIKSNRKGLIICAFLLIVQNCSGIIAVSLFSLTIFQSAGTAVTPIVSNIIFSMTMFIGTLIAPLFVERGGRRTLLLISTAGLTVTMAVLGVFFYLDDIEHGAVESIGWLPLVALIAALLSSSAGVSVIPHTLLGEVFRSNVRSIASSLCISLGFLAGFAVTLSFGYIMTGVGMFATFFMFAAINAFGLVFTAVLVPETKGMSLIEIEEMLSR